MTSCTLKISDINNIDIVRVPVQKDFIMYFIVSVSLCSEICILSQQEREILQKLTYQSSDILHISRQNRTFGL